MRKYENKYARVSELSSYYLCPRLAYFRRRHEPALSDHELRSGVVKSIAYALASIVSSPYPEAALDQAIRRACSDARLIYGADHEQAIIKAGQEAQARGREIVSGLFEERERSGEHGLMGVIAPSTVALAVYSDRLCLSGIIDKVVYDGGAIEPLAISASLPPETGIYASDRVRLAAYAMLLSEKYGVDCQAGAVEYVMGWCVRRAGIRHEDKRKALYARNRILEMATGRMPDAKRGKWCGHCTHYDACNVKASLLDGLFKKIEKT